MKITKLLTIISILLLFSHCTEIKNDLTRANLKGKVKSFEIKEYEVTEKFGEVIKGNPKYSTKKIYNEEGNVIEEANYNSNGDLYLRTIHKYNDSRKNESIEYSNGNLDSKTIYVYDDKENVSEERLYSSDGNLIFKIIYIYNDEGNVGEKREYDSIGEMYSKTVYEYNKKGDHIETRSYFSDGDLHYRITIKARDDKGSVVEWSYYNSLKDEPNENSFKNKYDKKGNWTGGIGYTNGILTTLTEVEIEYY